MSSKYRATISGLLLLILIPCLAQSSDMSQPGDAASIASLLRNVDSLLDNRQYDSAASSCAVAYSQARDRYGAMSAQTADCALKLGDCLLRQCDIRGADSLYRIAWQACSSAYGPESIQAGTARCRMGKMKSLMGDSTNIPVLRQSLDILQQAAGEDSPALISCLEELGDALALDGRRNEADTLFARARQIAEKTYGVESAEVAAVIAFQGNLRRQQGRYTEANSMLDYTLAVFERRPNTDSLDLARTLHCLALLYGELTRVDVSESLLVRAIDLYERVLGDCHPTVADAVLMLGNTHFRQSKLPEARREIEKARNILVNALGEDSPSLAYVDLYLVASSVDEDDSGQNESLLRHALRVTENAGPRFRRFRLRVMNYLARTLYRRDKRDEGEAMFRQQLDSIVMLNGPNHPDVAREMAEFAGLYNYSGEHEKADTLYERCIAIYTDVYGERNTFSAFLMSDWAMNLLAEGRIEKADSLVDRSLELQTDAPYARHESVYNITHQARAVIQGVTGQYAACRENLCDMYEFNLHSLADIFSYASDEAKLLFAQQQPPLDDKLFALALRDGDPITRDAALEMLLKCKSLLIDALSSDRAQLMCSDDPAVRTSIATHRDICSDISNITLSADRSESRDQRLHRLEKLFQQKDSVEAELSRQCARFQNRLHQYDFSIGDVAEKIPADAVLVEFVRSRAYRFDGPGTVFERYGDAHYLVFTLDRSGEVSLDDLGDAAGIDSLIRRTRKLIYEAAPHVYSARGASMETQLKQVTGSLYDKLIRPLESHIKGRKSVLVSPDGALNLLPLEILSMPDDRYLIEKYHVSYLSTGRDLLRFEKSGVDSGDAVVMVNPDFDYAGESDAVTRQLLRGSMFEDVMSLQPVMRGAPDCLAGRFSPLSHGEEEGKAIAKAFEGDSREYFREFIGPDAAEEVLKSFTTPPRLLHLATHGYFCGEPEDASESDVSGSANPLLRTGLALAGANRVIEGVAIENGSDDGILTGYEVSGLNLVGTELVTLSACETGIGDIVEGEGVFGLRRAFQQAGARAILMCMWRVPDKETAQVMRGFYLRWLGGMSKADALRESELEILHDARARFGHGHPLLWGGFILFGNPS